MCISSLRGCCIFKDSHHIFFKYVKLVGDQHSGIYLKLLLFFTFSCRNNCCRCPKKSGVAISKGWKIMDGTVHFMGLEYSLFESKRWVFIWFPMSGINLVLWLVGNDGIEGWRRIYRRSWISSGSCSWSCIYIFNCNNTRSGWVRRTAA